MYHNTNRRDSQNKKFAPILIITAAKSSFLCVQTNCVCQSDVWRFCKNDSDSSLESLIVTRVESFSEKRDSNRVTIVSQHDSSRAIDSSHVITAKYYLQDAAELIPVILKRVPVGFWIRANNQRSFNRKGQKFSAPLLRRCNCKPF